MELLTSEQMKKMDLKTINEIGVPSVALMELAGSGAARKIMERWNIKDANVLVIAGKGNNGGDGFVVARHLYLNGAKVNILLLGLMKELKGDAKTNANAARNLGINIYEILSASDFPHVEYLFQQTNIIIDAIFGTGLSRPVEGLPKEAISAINASDATVVSIDIPSGLSSDTGIPLDIAVQANLTVTFGFPKIGQFTSPGFEYCGDIEIIDISLERQGLPHEIFLTEDEWVKRHLPKRPIQGHKGTFGHVFAIAGSLGKTGAGLMLGEAAYRSGAGLVTLGVPGNSLSVITPKIKELMLSPISPIERNPNINDLSNILEQLTNKDVLAIGPGIITSQGMKKLLLELIKTVKIPIVIDADALNLIADNPKILKQAKNTPIITPHPGEMSRLTKLSIKEIQSDRLNIAKKFANEWNSILVLKGSRTIIASPDGKIFINPTGNQGMATGGSGDILTGIISSFIAQGASLMDAAVCGVYVHGKAGDHAAKELGPRGMIASDIIDFIPKILSWFDSK